MLHATWSLLLLLSAQAFTKTAAGPFDNSYIINPASYLDVIRPQKSNPTETAGTQLAQSSNSSTAQQTSDVGRSRHLLQAMQNPTRLQKPFNVCVSAWAPMVQCDPESDPSGYKGGPACTHTHTHAVILCPAVQCGACTYEAHTALFVYSVCLLSFLVCPPGYQIELFRMLAKEVS